MITMELTHWSYYGYMNREIKLVYARTEQGIFLSGTQIEENSSTTKCAAAVVTAICQREQINWQDQPFFDVQTYHGYPGTEEGWCAIYQLAIYGHDALISRVSQRLVVAPTTDARTNEKVAAAIPEEVRPAFMRLIG